MKDCRQAYPNLLYSKINKEYEVANMQRQLDRVLRDEEKILKQRAEARANDPCSSENRKSWEKLSLSRRSILSKRCGTSQLRIELNPSVKATWALSKSVKEFDNISTTHTLGEIGGKKIGDQGTAPKKVFYLKDQNSSEFSAEPTRWATLIPTVFNADTLGIRPDLIKRPISTWAELLNPEFKGKASILNIPSIGIMDAAMVVESMGEYQYPDKGNMTRDEIDMTIKILIEAKKAGQFRALWSDFNESVNLMASGEVVIQSMWSPAITAVRTQGIPCVYQPLKEGYRAWAVGFALSAATKGYQSDVCYEFINWYLSGFVGGHLNRQGYYSAVPSTAKEYMAGYEWDYWMLGKPAAQDIMAPDGKKLASVGEIRDGGSFETRMGGVACWNATMDENRYMVRKWNEFVAA